MDAGTWLMFTFPIKPHHFQSLQVISYRCLGHTHQCSIWETILETLPSIHFKSQIKTSTTNHQHLQYYIYSIDIDLNESNINIVGVHVHWLRIGVILNYEITRTLGLVRIRGWSLNRDNLECETLKNCCYNTTNTPITSIIITNNTLTIHLKMIQ